MINNKMLWIAVAIIAVLAIAFFAFDQQPPAEPDRSNEVIVGNEEEGVLIEEAGSEEAMEGEVVEEEGSMMEENPSN